MPSPDRTPRAAVAWALVLNTVVVMLRHLIQVDAVAAADLETVMATISPGLRQTLLGSDATP
ncbi:hypothetical protein [Streptomyces sp. R41]|uniref:Tetracyclin repressor-like C-terminal domain-containing protein n=1 Tax=Streptomyces sp. R41 TaxID=3238632 RepID=A0AB39RNA3_9ACTN